jgi:uncharacterized protein YbaA (DUF1428 family)
MAKYVDGFVLPVPKSKLPEYKKMAQMGGKVWKKYGALEYFECVGEDLDPKMGGMKFVKFPQLAKVKPGETVVFSFIVYKSRAHRDKVNALVMKDAMMNDPKYKDKPMPFDVKRMSYGGFKTLVDL